MNQENIMNQLQDIFRDVFDDDDMNIESKDNAESIEAWDSLAHINLIVAIEKEFQIKFALGELQDLKNIGDLVSAISEKCA